MRTPKDLGLPAAFAGWRPHQLDAILSVAASDKRFTALALPTGSGKSLIYVGIAKLLEARARVLTSTKGLQNQLMRDFGGTGLVDVRGQANYACELDRELRVSEGPCHEGMSCHLRENGCLYYDAVRRASQSFLTCTNYAFWLTVHLYGDGLGPCDLLILDEAHGAPDELAGFLEVGLSREEMDWIRAPIPESGWASWAIAAKEEVRRRAEGAGLAGGERAQGRARVRSLLMKLSRLAAADEKEWVHVPGREPRWAPVWPDKYGRLLWREAKRVLLTSATIRPKTLELLGLKPEEYEFLEYPSTFAVDRRPVYWIPTARIDKRATPAHYRAWIDRIDEIIAGRLDRKGLVHTVSYDRARTVLENSRHRGIMLFHDRHTARQVVERFKAAPAPAVLVSPSMATGYDFPYDAARYQIVGKVPFPDTRDPVTKERSRQDKEYPMFLAMTELVQTAGRVVRAEDDYGETFVIDDNVQWFVNKYGKFAPRWFLDAYKKKRQVPEPGAQGVVIDRRS